MGTVRMTGWCHRIANVVQLGGCLIFQPVALLLEDSAIISCPQVKELVVDFVTPAWT